MVTRIALDFRHGLTEPRITDESEGTRFALTRGQEEVVILLPRHALEALWLAVTAALHGTEPC